MPKSSRRPVTTTAAHPEALAKALELAGGDKARIEVQSDGSVLVVNPRPRGARRRA